MGIPIDFFKGLKILGFSRGGGGQKPTCWGSKPLKRHWKVQILKSKGKFPHYHPLGAPMQQKKLTNHFFWVCRFFNFSDFFPLFGTCFWWFRCCCFCCCFCLCCSFTFGRSDHVLWARTWIIDLTLPTSKCFEVGGRQFVNTHQVNVGILSKAMNGLLTFRTARIKILSNNIANPLPLCNILWYNS